jgi:hypothetical protein
MKKMKNLIFIAILSMNFSVINGQVNEIYTVLNSGKELLYKNESKGCLTLNKSNMKQSYSLNCEKPMDFTIKTMKINGSKIELSMVLHYYGDVNLYGTIEVLGGILVLSYGESMNNRNQVDKYKLK